MTRSKLNLFGLLLLIYWVNLSAATPPFNGTIFLDPDIILPGDPTAFKDIEDKGQGIRTMFDRRMNQWIQRNAFLFKAKYDDGLSIEVQINPEFETTRQALHEAKKYAPVIGRLPTSLRQRVKTVWIHKGTEPFGGGNNNLLIHTGQAARYARDGILEETFVHEASHTSLDPLYRQSEDWKKAQEADDHFISTYARDFPDREDIAESFLLYFALDYRRNRISTGLADTIERTIPNRILFFRQLELNYYPVTPAEPVTIQSFHYDRTSQHWHLEWNAIPGRLYQIFISPDLQTWSPVSDRLETSDPVIMWSQKVIFDFEHYALKIQ